jgi:hypothetical protein
MIARKLHTNLCPYCHCKILPGDDFRTDNEEATGLMTHAHEDCIYAYNHPDALKEYSVKSVRQVHQARQQQYEYEQEVLKAAREGRVRILEPKRPNWLVRVISESFAEALGMFLHGEWRVIFR